jgi:hypothetical protein
MASMPSVSIEGLAFVVELNDSTISSALADGVDLEAGHFLSFDADWEEHEDTDHAEGHQNQGDGDLEKGESPISCSNRACYRSAHGHVRSDEGNVDVE